MPHVILTPHIFTLMTETSESPHKSGFIGWMHNNTDPLSNEEIIWSSRWWGLGVGERHDQVGYTFTNIDGTSQTFPVQYTYRSIPYWFITIPLTLLSAYLLLSKQRVAKLKSASDKPLSE
ncbi:MAG: hypothetical protein WCH39_20705 [Schlesneria sp.]